MLFDLSNDELKIILKNIQSFDNDLDKFSKDTLSALNEKLAMMVYFLSSKALKIAPVARLKRLAKVY